MPSNVAYHSPGDLPAVIPVFPLAGALLLPRGQMPLNIFEPRYLAMVDDALRSGLRLIGMIQPDPAHPGSEDRPNLYRVGCVGRITQLAESGDGRYLMQLTGISRFRIDSLIHSHNDLIGGQPALGIDCPAELPIDHFADSFQHATHQTLRQNGIALWLGA